MSRPVVPPDSNEHGDDVHPAFGLIGASRVSTSAPGATLFDSDIRHNHTVIVRLYTASRNRNLSHDWMHPAGSRAPFVEVEMSEAQWASFVSSMNTGHGVPCTIRRREDGEQPGLPYEPRLAQSMDEVREAADRMLEGIRKAFAAVEAKPTKANIRTLHFAIQNATPNVTFAAQSLNEHAENVVQRARADIEAMVLSKATQLGLDPSAMGVPQLEAGTGEEER